MLGMQAYSGAAFVFDVINTITLSAQFVGRNTLLSTPTCKLSLSSY